MELVADISAAVTSLALAALAIGLSLQAIRDRAIEKKQRKS
jgi:hypothetical protein